MNDTILTRDADKLICEIYRIFLQKRSAGETKPAAKRFTLPFGFDDDLFREWQSADFHDTLCELKEKGLIKLFIDGNFDLHDHGIIYMENRFPQGLGQVLETLAKIKNAIPLL